MHFNRSVLFGAAVAAFLCAGATIPARAGDSWHLSVGADDHATAEQVGLPVYPGSWQWKKDKDGDKGSAHVWALLGHAGFKVAVMKLGSNDTPAKVAAFYRPALAKYGPILDCSGPNASKRHLGEGDDKLTCDDNDPDPGELVFKSGKDNDQHIVSVKPHGQGSEINLVFVQVKGFD